MVDRHAGEVLAAEGTVFGLGVPVSVEPSYRRLEDRYAAESTLCNQCGL